MFKQRAHVGQYIQCTISKRRLSTKAQVTVRSALGRSTPYIKGWAWQHVLLERRLQYLRFQQSTNDGLNAPQHGMSDRDWLLLFEHEPVYTLGRGASEKHLTFLTHEDKEDMKRLSKKYRGIDAARLLLRSKFQINVEDNQLISTLIQGGAIQNCPVYAPNKVPIYRIERGGEVTFHGPGQLVLYPMLNLRHSPFKQDLHWYLRQIEEVIILTLQHYDINANRDGINTGVWVGLDKIAAVGVSSSRWITTHGCALNVNSNLDAFSKEIITPCGIEERGVTSLYDLMGENCPSMKDVADVMMRCFGEVFDVELVEGDDIT
jgi:lipoyl(octanoyl) transferase